MKGSDGFSVGGSRSFVLRVQHPLFSVSLGRRVETATLGFKARNLSLSEHEHVGQEKFRMSASFGWPSCPEP